MPPHCCGVPFPTATPYVFHDGRELACDSMWQVAPMHDRNRLARMVAVMLIEYEHRYPDLHLQRYAAEIAALRSRNVRIMGTRCASVVMGS